jgi:hypothetical protein
MANELVTERFRLERPPSLVPLHGRPADGLEDTILLRGRLCEDVPCTAVVSVRRHPGTTLSEEMRELTRWFEDGPQEGTPVLVPGAHGARRADGLLTLEEGVGREPEWLERVTVLAATRRRELVVLVVRVGANAGADDEVEALLDSFALLP